MKAVFFRAKPGEGRENFLEKVFPPFPRTPFLLLSKTFGLIESLFARFLKHGRGIHTFNESDNITF